MKTTILLVVVILAVASIEGRSYYGKRPIKERCPPIPCTYIHIPPGCSRNTYYFHNGIRCQGCPENICGSWQNQWDNNNWQQGGNRWPRRNNRQLRQNWQNGQFW